jgi:hypothetical protein
MHFVCYLYFSSFSLYSLFLFSCYHPAKAVTKSESTVIHVKGATRLFSLYSIGTEYALAFYTAFDTEGLESFDMEAADASMLGPLQDLERKLKSIKWGT